MPAQEDLFRTACSLPRLAVSSLSGGGGKTLLSLGLAGALTERGLEVVPFKKGPDYIDAAWLAAAAGRPSSNLDPFFLASGRLRSLFVHQASRTASPAALAEGRCLALVEGNRGLYDGMDLEGSCSTAALARDLDAPVLLSLNATKMTRTAAALIQGVMGFEKGLRFAGVVLNQVGRSRHGSYLRACIERYTDMPVLGELPRLAENPLPERQMGIASLLGDRLSETCESALAILKAHVRENVDVDRIFEASRTAGRLEHVAPFWDGASRSSRHCRRQGLQPLVLLPRELRGLGACRREACVRLPSGRQALGFRRHRCRLPGRRLSGRLSGCAEQKPASQGSG